ncbi:hypothetical protein VCHA53O466_40415 [Vibrio chagasii]|nr:hypothetical protein VCHA53O466_40415 [Vibrio chagasii]
MILDDNQKNFLLVPACGIECTEGGMLDNISINSTESSLIDELIQSEFYNDCSIFTEVVFTTKLAKIFKEDYLQTFNKLNTKESMYIAKGEITLPVNKITREILRKNIK